MGRGWKYTQLYGKRKLLGWKVIYYYEYQYHMWALFIKRLIYRAKLHSSTCLSLFLGSFASSTSVAALHEKSIFTIENHQINIKNFQVHGQCRTGQSRAGQGRAGQDRAGQGMAVHGYSVRFNVFN